MVVSKPLPDDSAFSGALNGSSIPLYRPEISEEDVEAVAEVLKLRSFEGLQTAEFELALSRFLNAKHVVAVSSGTAALHLSLASLNLSPGDEVITTPFTYVSSVNCILYNGLRPVFVDIEEDSLNLDASQLPKVLTPKTRAILPVHIFGRPCQMDAIVDFARRHDLEIIEDACQALGARYNGQRLGTFGRAAAIGFHASKHITTGEGGAIVTDDDHVAALCRSLRHQGRPMPGEADGYARLGYNYKLSDMQAALGLSQLCRLDSFLLRRANIAAWYGKLLAGIDEIHLPPAPGPGVTVAWFAYVVRLQKTWEEKDRDALLRELRAGGIECSNYFPPLHLQPYIRQRFGFAHGDFPVCERTAARTLALPFSAVLTYEEVRRVSETLKTSIVRLASSTPRG